MWQVLFLTHSMIRILIASFGLPSGRSRRYFRQQEPPARLLVARDRVASASHSGHLEQVHLYVCILERARKKIFRGEKIFEESEGQDF
jgi:hypothetical protein